MKIHSEFFGLVSVCVLCLWKLIWILLHTKKGINIVDWRREENGATFYEKTDKLELRSILNRVLLLGNLEVVRVDYILSKIW